MPFHLHCFFFSNNHFFKHQSSYVCFYYILLSFYIFYYPSQLIYEHITVLKKLFVVLFILSLIMPKTLFIFCQLFSFKFQTNFLSFWYYQMRKFWFETTSTRTCYLTATMNITLNKQLILLDKIESQTMLFWTQLLQHNIKILFLWKSIQIWF